MSSIKSIVKKKIENERLYNLAVKDDESYIADGIVVHNCRSTLIPILKDEIEQGKIFGASEEENAQFFNEAGKFQESSKDLGGFKMLPGGFYVEK